MSRNGSGYGERAVTALAGAGGSFLARKVIGFAWTKVTGRKPPDKPEDTEVSLGEAMIWAVVAASAVAAARVLATRLVASQARRNQASQ